LAGVIEGYLYQWRPDGKYLSQLGDNPRDLFMAHIKKTGWVARYSDGMTSRWVRETEEAIRDAHPGALSYHQIEWEE
jgi:hypothetical protein